VEPVRIKTVKPDAAIGTMGEMYEGILPVFNQRFLQHSKARSVAARMDKIDSVVARMDMIDSVAFATFCMATFDSPPTPRKRRGITCRSIDDDWGA
jgi:hypothetical protein